ncbi:MULTISPECIES: xanthine dehydrogenase family protein subunit M [unclassified Bradyrhizobium]|uniref:FAD binding domain-containing protein n=1 Tax=unclassified Bradyrhizobium TaxID=2631580 RepID=UPI001FF793E0|nr:MULTISPECIES: xanthine dehydrogenase family protein subunit M [unclassified Bradyrhizobium]MCK1713413.1 xanthine dehydrogenase family protein subunit M [Bradyrhizobium sp. 143]MCK1730458.1 xanthine dehydrogenase family protein subunit M [Bradyrhizobium sp. 142]
MKPAPFKYIAASSVDHALALKAEHGDEARFLAGGQSLIPAMNFRLARPSVLIDINGLGAFAGVERSESAEIRIGALTRYHSLERDRRFLTDCPLFADALPHIAHPQIRNRGTIGGNLAHADPASELPAIAVAMQARMRIRSAKGEREVAASEFFQGLLTTDIQSDEMLVEIAFPAPAARTGACFIEVARRRGDFALAGVAAVVTTDARGRCSQLRLVLCGVGEKAVDASAAAASLVGQACAGEAIETVAAEVQGMIDPPGNMHASPDYQRHIAGVLAQRAISAAFSRAGYAA